MLRECEFCGQQIPWRRSTNARFCKDSCKSRAYRFRKADPVPRELRKLSRWVNWRIEDGKKVPKQTNGRNASSSQPTSWSPYSDARHAAVGTDKGVGFVLNGDGVACVDLDHCLDPDSFGGITAFAREILRMLPTSGTYVEISPSGDGLHVWGTGDVKRGRRTNFRGQPVELYGTGRFMTVTGKPFDNAPSRLADIQALIDFIGTL